MKTTEQTTPVGPYQPKIAVFEKWNKDRHMSDVFIFSDLKILMQTAKMKGYNHSDCCATWSSMREATEMLRTYGREVLDGNAEILLPPSWDYKTTADAMDAGCYPQHTRRINIAKGLTTTIHASLDEEKNASCHIDDRRYLFCGGLKHAIRYCEQKGIKITGIIIDEISKENNDQSES